jgi:hypothetical protein
VVEKSLVDIYVPFLPMERRHVLLCVQQEAARRCQPTSPNLACSHKPHFSRRKEKCLSRAEHFHVLPLKKFAVPLFVQKTVSILFRNQTLSPEIEKHVADSLTYWPEKTKVYR